MMERAVFTGKGVASSEWWNVQFVLEKGLWCDSCHRRLLLKFSVLMSLDLILSQFLFVALTAGGVYKLIVMIFVCVIFTMGVDSSAHGSVYKCKYFSFCYDIQVIDLAFTPPPTSSGRYLLNNLLDMYKAEMATKLCIKLLMNKH